MEISNNLNIKNRENIDNLQTTQKTQFAGNIFDQNIQANQPKQPNEYNASQIYDDLNSQIVYPNDDELFKKIKDLQAKEMLPPQIKAMFDRYNQMNIALYSQVINSIKGIVSQNTTAHVQALNNGEQNPPMISEKTTQIMNQLLPLTQEMSSALQPMADQILKACEDYEANQSNAKLDKNQRKFEKKMEKTKEKMPELNKKLEKINTSLNTGSEQTLKNNTKVATLNMPSVDITI